MSERCTAVYSGPITHSPSMLCVWVKVLSHTSAKKKGKKASGFQISDFNWSFSCDIMALKWLMRNIRAVVAQTKDSVIIILILMRSICAVIAQTNDSVIIILILTCIISAVRQRNPV